jgi:hypothetical protein
LMIISSDASIMTIPAHILMTGHLKLLMKKR